MCVYPRWNSVLVGWACDGSGHSDWLTAPVGLRDYLQSFGMKKLAHQRGLCMRGGTDERL